MTCLQPAPLAGESLSHLEQCEPIRDMLGERFIPRLRGRQTQRYEDMLRRDQPLGWEFLLLNVRSVPGEARPLPSYRKQVPKARLAGAPATRKAPVRPGAPCNGEGSPAINWRRCSPHGENIEQAESASPVNGSDRAGHPRPHEWRQDSPNRRKLEEQNNAAHHP